MAIIYTYPTKATPIAGDLILISDSADSNKTKQITVGSLPFTNNPGTVTSVGLSMPSAFEVGNTPVTSSGTISVATVGGNAGQFLAYDGTWGTPAGGAANPAGDSTEVQYNSGGTSFGADELFTYANRTLSLGKVAAAGASHLKVYGGGSDDGKLTIYCSAGTHGVTIDGPDHTGGTPASYTIKLPNSLPSVANQILESNASGTLSWIATPTGGGSYSAGDGIDLNGTVFSAGRLTNGGLTIDGGKLQVKLNDTAMSGELRAVDGGTGYGTYVVGEMLYAETTSTLAQLSLGTNDKILGVNNGATAPEWITNLVGQEVTTGHMLIGAGTSAMTAIDPTDKGKIVVGNGSTTTTKIVGTDGYVLTARSSDATGVNWEAPAAVNLASGVTGTLPVGNGGTGSSANPAIQGSILFSNSSGIYTTATSLKYDNSMLSSLSTSTSYPSVQTSSANATSATASSGLWSTTIGAVNMYNSSSTAGATTLAIAGEDTVQANVARLISFYGATSGGPGLYACGYLLADRGSNSVSLSNQSDYRLKENVLPLTSSTDKIKALNPVSYNFIGQTKLVEGFLAHEIQAQFPAAVIGEKDAVTENGEINPQLLDYTKIIPALVGTIKELTARIEALEA